MEYRDPVFTDDKNTIIWRRWLLSIHLVSGFIINNEVTTIIMNNFNYRDGGDERDRTSFDTKDLLSVLGVLRISRSSRQLSKSGVRLFLTRNLRVLFTDDFPITPRLSFYFPYLVVVFSDLTIIPTDSSYYFLDGYDLFHPFSIKVNRY